MSAFSFKHLFVIPDARSAIRNPGANTQPVAPGFRGLRFAEPRNDELLGSFDLFALPHLGPGARACAILVDPVRIKKSKGGTRICHAKECAVGSALIDAANPRPVIGSIGAVAGDVSLSEAARPMACGFVVRHESPVLLPAFSCSAGFSVFALARYAGSRSITSLVASVRTLANCPPAERWNELKCAAEV